MDRKALEALSSEELRQLIAEAASVLAARAGAATGGLAAATGSEKSSGTGSLFTFGIVGAGSGAGSSQAEQSGGLFGGVKLFGGTGSGLFTGATAATSTGGTYGSLFGDAAASGAALKFSPPARDAEEAGATTEPGEEGNDDDRFVPHEEVTAINGWTPSVSLQIADSIETGEEGEDQVYSQRSKLYRFIDGEWKERGLGEARLLKNKVTGRVRFLLRQEKTGKVAANHFVVLHKPYCDLKMNADSKKIWVWCAQDFADGELKVEEFGLKFGTEELAEKFKEAFEDAQRQNAEARAAEEAGREEAKPEEASEEQSPELA